MIYFTADHHFDHANVIRYCNRPFSSVEEMNYELITRWNSKVTDNDEVFHLGDFTLGNNAEYFFSQLSGRIFVVNNKYHHDKRWQRHAVFHHSRNGSVVVIVDSIYSITINGQYVTMSHFPIEEWDRKHYGSIHLHGHSHGNSRKVENRYDVGVDCWNFYPVTLEEILNEKTKVSFKNDFK